jgi:hypothetical protein
LEVTKEQLSILRICIAGKVTMLPEATPMIDDLTSHTASANKLSCGRTNAWLAGAKSI